MISTSTGSSTDYQSTGQIEQRKSISGQFGPVKSQSVPPISLPTTSIEYEQLNKKATSAPMSASSSRSESPMSDRYCGRCSSLISLHLRTIESDGELTRTAATQTRPQSKGKMKQKRPRKTSRSSLENASPSRKSVKNKTKLRQLESTSSKPSLHSNT